MTKRFTIDKEYDTDGNWEYCYVDNDTERTFNFADDFCDNDFIEYVNAIISSFTDENEQLKEEIARQKYTKHIMRENIKNYERAIKRLRKSYEEFDEMRLERIRFLEKRLKKNGLSIYVNGCGDLE